MHFNLTLNLSFGLSEDTSLLAGKIGNFIYISHVTYLVSYTNGDQVMLRTS